MGRTIHVFHLSNSYKEITMKLIVVLIFAAVFAVQGLIEKDHQSNSFEFDALQPLMFALSSITSFSSSNREQSLTHLKSMLPPAEFETVMHSLITLDRANETLQYALPARRKSLYALTDALPAFTSIVTQYQKAVKKGNEHLSKDVHEKLFQLFPVLNEALEQLTPAFPILADTLTMMTKELPQLARVMPAFHRSFSSQNAVIRYQLAFSLPAYGKASDSFHDNISKFNEYSLPHLVSFLSSLYRFSRNNGIPSPYQYNKPMYNSHYSNYPEHQDCSYSNNRFLILLSM